MKKIILYSALALAFLINFPANSYNFGKINANNPEQLLSNISKQASIKGKIYSSEISDKEKVIFLNFGENYNTSLSVIIYSSDIPLFISSGINEPEKFFLEKTVEVEGIIRLSAGKPEIVINSPEQIKVIKD